MVWLQFTVCASALTFFAYLLCREGAIVSAKTRIERAVMGMFFLGVATSFPEIVTATSSVYSFGNIGLGYGDIMGSVIINLMILSLIDMFSRSKRILSGAYWFNRSTGLFAAGISGMILLSVILRTLFPVSLRFGLVGLESIVVGVIYLVYLRQLKNAGRPGHVNAEPYSFWMVWAKFFLLLLVVMVLGVWMAAIGDRIVSLTGLSGSFVGSLFLGFATSLPEIIVAFSAFFAAGPDMALGNILGSNIFDISLIPVLDLLTENPILGMIDLGSAVATLFAFILSVLACFGMFYAKKTARRINWNTSLFLILGFFCFVLIYLLGK